MLSAHLFSAKAAIHRAPGAAPLGFVLNYVEAQQEHHRARTFQEEYRELLPRKLSGLTSTSGMFGIENTRRTESRFQRLVSGHSDSWGHAPG
jgi:hypothetical protein